MSTMHASDSQDGGTLVANLRRQHALPVFTVHRSDDVLPTLEALEEGGLSHVEVTLRTSHGLAALEAASAAGHRVGAGTVLGAEQAREAIGAGASFVVSPGLDPHVVTVCRAAHVPCIPGVATPTEVIHAVGLGLTLLKVFPVQQLGGAGFVRALAQVFTGIEFLPSGGIDAVTAREHLGVGAVAAVSGSWMIPDETVRAGRYDLVAQAATSCASLAGARP